MIVRVTEPAPDPKVVVLRGDLSREYYEALHVVLDFHGRLITIKGWSVTASLAALAFGFQQRHYALFALAAVTGAGFWAFDTVMTRFQRRYFTRLQEIEYAAYLINPVRLKGEYGDKEISAPRIRMTWSLQEHLVKDGNPPRRWRRAFTRAKEPQASLAWGADEPSRPDVKDVYWALRSCWWRGNVMLPHVIAVVLGSLLFIIFAFAALRASGFAHWRL
jgi:hypothetical protein